MTTVQVELTEEQASAIQRMAELRGATWSSAIAHVLDRYFGLEARPDRDEIRRRAKAAAGAGDSGLTDVSRKHDDYLAEAFADGDLR